MTRKFRVGVCAVVSGGQLQVEYRIGIPHVRIAAGAPVKIAGIVQNRNALGVFFGIADRMSSPTLF